MNKLSCSIIAPVFNEKEGIREFIHALINQTRTPDEIIIVDG
jgi:glycosyltransferase involved in cell wall biosynthesis